MYLLPRLDGKGSMQKSPRRCAGLAVRRLTPLLLQARNKALTETSSRSLLGVGTGCLGQSPPDFLQTFFRAKSSYGPCKRLPLLLTMLSGICMFQHAIWSKLSNGNVVLKTQGDRTETSPATACLLPVRYTLAGSVQVYQVGWKKVGST